MKITEHSSQSRVVQYIRTFYPEILVFAIPNGANVNANNRIRLSKEGLLSGLPDLWILEKRKGFNGLLIEFKTEIGKLSDNQHKLIKQLNNRHYFCTVARSHTTAIKMIEDYLF